MDLEEFLNEEALAVQDQQIAAENSSFGSGRRGAPHNAERQPAMISLLRAKISDDRLCGDEKLFAEVRCCWGVT